MTDAEKVLKYLIDKTKGNISDYVNFVNTDNNETKGINKTGFVESLKKTKRRQPPDLQTSRE